MIEHIPFLGIYEEPDGSLTVNCEKLAVAKNSTFRYSKGADVQAVWRANGWKAPTTYRNDFLFAENRKAAGLSR